MDYASIVSKQVISLFVILVVGYLASSFGFISKKTADGMSKLLVYVTNPLLIFMAFQQGIGANRWGEMLTVMGASCIIHIGATVLTLFTFRSSPGRERNALRFSVIFSNCGYMGYPLLRAVFPQNGTFYGACYVLFFTVYMWTVGVFMLSSGKKGVTAESVKKAVLNPGVIAALLGLLFCVLGINLPSPVASAFNSTADMTFPLAMLVLGNMLRFSPLKSLLANASAYFASFVKLLLIPAVVLLICVICGCGEGTTYICVIMAATPCATKAPIMAEIYGADRTAALAATAISSIACLLTIPLMMYLTKMLI